MNRHNSTNQIRNFLRNPCRVICDIFAWFWCVVCGPYIFTSKTINYILNFLTSNIFAWFWCVVCGPYIFIYKTINYILNFSISDIFAWFWCVVRRLYIYFSTAVKVHVLVAGETFRTHETFVQMLNLRIEQDCRAESSDVILLFCPVVSRIGTDMEAAMARVTGNKPVILVFMHHCHSPSHMTNTTVQPSRSNIVQVVHYAFLENAGLLQCQENEQAVSEVRRMLQKYQQGNVPSTEEIFKSV